MLDEKHVKYLFYGQILNISLITHCTFFKIRAFFVLYHTRIEEFAKDEVDLTLSTCLEFNTPLADLSDVKTMMDSINVVPGLNLQIASSGSLSASFSVT